ncbi:DUF6114 domain-containing protein, partial [Streptomyces sp. NPDC052015]|uniref:DUF6114 domain-containing protein n=1 Tax=Streptomyces sp. NPDC052015 TaxID=3154755 RepID=UPI0034341A74
MASRPRSAFRRWRASRPFWGGLLLTLGGAEVLLTEKVSLKVVMHIGMQGLAGYLLPVVMTPVETGPHDPCRGPLSCVL